MLIENESNWSTEDLVALTEAVAGKIGNQVRHGFKQDTLLLFKTSRKRERKGWRGAGQHVVKPPTAYAQNNRHGHANTVVVYIASAKRLQMEVLDRMANITDEGRQDMSSEDVVKVAKAIGSAIGGWRFGNNSYEWAANSPMRARSRGAKSKVATRRKIEKLREEQENYRRWAANEIEKLEKKIEALQSELD
jgi:hypothetical protein